ncbi:MAG TPA: dUTP diphosphatase [Chlamydiales bacterium]|nr:dUTP diphosphatase [Chlamydiales bacterium]
MTLPVLVEDPELIPTYATESSSGCDARAAVHEHVTIMPGESAIIPTGLRVEIPAGYEIQVRPRSGFAAKHQITVLNTPGTIDADYRGEISVILINHGKKPFIVEPKMRIAQLVLAPVVQAEFIQKELLAVTCRGEGKFGHTGAK